MSVPYQTKKQLILGQISIIIFALVAGYLGRGSKAYWLFVIIYFIAFAVLMQKFGQPGKQKKVNPAEVETGKILYEEKNSMELLSGDPEYQREMQEQMKLMQTNMLIMLPIMAYFFIAYKPIVETIPPYFSNEHLGFTVAYLVLFEGSFILSRIGQVYIEKRMQKQGKKSTLINTPRGFIITTEGIVYQGIASKNAIKFPLIGYEVRYDAKRRFVELVQETEKMITKIRLYTKNPEKAYELITRRNEKAMKKLEK